ncbi:MAG: LytTR family transcriptional regulator DNA-binding domain-containing protein [Polaribacter sp.]|uniref:LytTR family transcriptional regulator DNA-binding domain-containing protein n=1 Tax=Polaribacter sp. TaxID=1920175 RepID=UPI0032646B3C
MNKIINWLATPYYFNPTIKFKLKSSFILGFFTFSFLYIFRPFYLAFFSEIILTYSILIGFIGFIAAFFTLYIPPLIFKNYFNEDSWTTGRSIFLMIIGNLIAAILIWYFGEMYKEPYNLKKISLPLFIVFTFLVSSIPLIFFLFLNEQNVRKKREKKAEEINTLKKEKKTKKEENLDENIVLYSDNKKEQISFNINDLVYITSQGNYASFFLNKNNVLKEQILRITLTKINVELENFDTIIRCHKSYIVNSNYISKISGNARGYLLKSDVIPLDIPVSRKFSKLSLQSLLH